jgi:hypothetical protein
VSKRRKQTHGLSDTVGKVMSKKVQNPQPSDCLDFTARDISADFVKRNGTTLEAVTAAIDQAAVRGCGDDLLLWDASLIGLAQRVRDYLSSAAVQVVGKAQAH